MNLISRYILRAHIGPFLFGASTVIFIFLLQFLIINIEKLLGRGLGLWVILQVIVLSLAWMVVLAVPLGVLTSTLMSFGNISAANEITAIKAGHGSLLRMMRPVIISAALLGIGLFWFNDKILPETNHQFSMLMYDIQRKKPTFALEAGQFSTQIDQYSILARSIDSTGRLYGVTIYDNTDYRRLNVISADSGRIAFAPDFTKLIVRMYNGEAHQVNQSDYGDLRKVRFATHRIIMPAAGFMFERTDKELGTRGDRELSIAAMQERVDMFSANATSAKQRYDSIVQAHVQYILYGIQAENKLSQPKNKLGTLSSADKNALQNKRESALSQQQPERILSQSSIIADSLSINDDIKRFSTPSVLTTELQPLQKAENIVSSLFSLLQTDFYRYENQQQEAYKYLVEIHKKYAIPAACLVFALVGCPLGIITRRGNFGVSGAISLGFYVVYWACLIGGEKLADRGFVEPWLGMWFANMLIGVIGIFLVLKVSNERVFFGWRERRKALRFLETGTID